MRTFRRLTTAWAVIIGIVAVGIGLNNGTLAHANWPFIGFIALVPLAIALILEWANTPPPS